MTPGSMKFKLTATIQVRMSSMDYEKPEVTTLGSAQQIIEQMQRKPRSATIDPHQHRNFFNPAYDLDE